MEREGHTRQQDEKGHPTVVAKFCLKTDIFFSEHLSGHQLAGQLSDVVGWELVCVLNTGGCCTAASLALLGM